MAPSELPENLQIDEKYFNALCSALSHVPLSRSRCDTPVMSVTHHTHEHQWLCSSKHIRFATEKTHNFSENALQDQPNLTIPRDDIIPQDQLLTWRSPTFPGWSLSNTVVITWLVGASVFCFGPPFPMYRFPNQNANALVVSMMYHT